MIAIEPHGDYEHVFDGEDSYWAAVEYAAEQLRREA